MVPHKNSFLHLIAHALYIMKLHDSTQVRIYATYYEFKFKKKKHLKQICRVDIYSILHEKMISEYET